LLNQKGVHIDLIQLGYKILEIPIKYRKRLGKKKLGFRHGLKILRKIVIERISIAKINKKTK